jgi:hypothetical protein
MSQTTDERSLKMSTVEEAYQAAVHQMTPTQKIQRMLELNQWAHWNIERCIIEEFGPLPPEVMKWRVALWIYGNNAESRQLIEEQLARVQNP